MTKDFLSSLGIDDTAIESILGEYEKSSKAHKDLEKELKALKKSTVAKSDYESIVKELDELKGSSLSESEKMQKALEASKAAEMQFKTELAKLKVKEVFVGAGLTEQDYENLMPSISTDDADGSVATAQQIVSLIKSRTDAESKRIREELLKSTPGAQGSGRDNDGGGELSLGARMAQQYGQKFLMGDDK